MGFVLGFFWGGGLVCLVFWLVWFFVEVKQERFKDLTPEEALIACRGKRNKTLGGCCVP